MNRAVIVTNDSTNPIVAASSGALPSDTIARVNSGDNAPSATSPARTATEFRPIWTTVKK